MVVQGGNISQPKFIRYYKNGPSSSKDSLTVNDYLLVESRDKYPWMTEENIQEERLEGQEKRTGDDEELTKNDENLQSNKKVFDRTGDDEEVKNDDKDEDLQSNKEIFDKTEDDEEVKNDDEDEDLQSNKEVFDRILKFKKMHGRFPDLNDAEEKKMIGVSGNENLEENRDDEEGSTLDEDFPSPFLQEELDTDKVEDIFSTVDRNVKETTVVYKEDEKGNIRIQRFIQTKHEDGTFTTEIYELKKDEEMTEKSPFSEQNEEEEEEGQGTGEDYFQDPENFDQDFEEQTQGNLMETPFSPERTFLLFIYIALEVSLMKSTHTFSCSMSGYFLVFVLFCFGFFFNISDHQVFSRSLQSLTPMFDM